MDKWDLRFIKIAKEISTWSKDINRKVGAVIVKDRRILSTGYNGLPSGFPDGESVLNAYDKNLYTIHAEANAIANTKVPLDGATIYVAGLHPCSQCAALIAQAGIKRVVYDTEPSKNSTWYSSIKAAKVIFDQLGIVYECTLPEVIMIGGKKRAGKTWLAKQLGCPMVSFADAPRDIFRRTFGVEFDLVKTMRSKLLMDLTARKMMQHLATDACQGVFGKTVWRDIVIDRLQELKLKGVETVVIPDWRFKHEIIEGATKIYVLGGEDHDDHISENDISEKDADVIYDNTNHNNTNLSSKFRTNHN